MDVREDGTQTDGWKDGYWLYAFRSKEQNLLNLVVLQVGAGVVTLI